MQTEQTPTKEPNVEVPIATRIANADKYRWLIRPCYHYKDEYDECRTLYNKFNWYYVYGRTPDCSQWFTDYQNCTKYVQTKSDESMVELIESEKRRRVLRLRTQVNNNVWKYRDSPPPEWTSELPEHLRCPEDAKVLQGFMEKDNTGSMCSIM